MEDASLGTAEAEQLGPSLWVLGLAGEHDLSTAPRCAALATRETSRAWRSEEVGFAGPSEG